MFALANINMFGMVDASNGMAVRVFRCATCFTLELRDISQEEFDSSIKETRDMHGPHS